MSLSIVALQKGGSMSKYILGAAMLVCLAVYLAFVVAMFSGMLGGVQTSIGGMEVFQP